MTTIAANSATRSNFAKPELTRAPALQTVAAPPAAAKPSVASKVTDSFSKAGSAVANGASKAGSAVVNGATTAGSAVANGATKVGSAVGDGFSKAGGAVKGWHNDSANRLTTSHQNGGTGLAGRGLAGAGLAGGVASIGANGKGLVDAIRNGEGGHAIAQNALGLTRGILGATKGALDTAAAFSSANAFGKLAEAAKGAVGNKAGPLGGAIANAAAGAAHKGTGVRHADVMASVLNDKGFFSSLKTGTQMGVADLLRQGGFKGAAGKIEGSVIKAGEKAAGGAIDAAQATKAAGAAFDGVKAGAKGAGTAAKIAGRFAPGLNIGIAALDAGIAARTWADPKSSTAAKVTSTITAAGSAAAATNIPIVSQIGAGISAASSITGLAIENAGKIKDGFKSLGNKIKNLF
jgi:hypothetical protein